MEENNSIDKDQNSENELNKASKPEKKEKSKKPSQKSGAGFLSSKFNEYKGEFRKIVWPSRKDLYKQTVTVVVISLLVGAVIFLMDTVYGGGWNWIVEMVSQNF